MSRLGCRWRQPGHPQPNGPPTSLTEVDVGHAARWPSPAATGRAAGAEDDWMSRPVEEGFEEE
jgi:hypothetical protein